MLSIRNLHRGSISALDYQCTASPCDEPYWEVHQNHSVSYVRKGSFGCQSLGHRSDLVAGSILVGKTASEFRCTHDHHAGGDECLSFHLQPDLAEDIGERSGVWEVVAVPPLAEIIGFGELAQAAAEGRCDLGVDEAGIVLTARLAEVISGRRRKPVKLRPLDCRRAVESALWIDECAEQPLNLDSVAQAANLSPFHFLRVFAKALGVTPHQFLIRSRLRRAARLLSIHDRSVTDVAADSGFSDLSNFVRTFHRATGMSPTVFRRAARGDRNFLQDRFSLDCYRSGVD